VPTNKETTKNGPSRLVIVSTMATSLLTGVAAAGVSVTLHFELDNDPLTGPAIVSYQGEPVRWTVYASFSGYGSADAYFGGFVGSFDPVVTSGGSGDATVNGSVSNLSSLMAGEGTPAQGNGASVESVNIFHSALLGTDNPSNPLAIFAFDLSVSSVSGSIDPDAPPRLTYTADGIASVFANSSIFLLPDEFTEIAVLSDVLAIPAPGVALSAGVIGVGMLRRRRGPSGRTRR